MKIEHLKLKIASKEIDTVMVVFPDVFGRLVGKRVTGSYFLDHIVPEGTHGCNYLLTVNLEMDPVAGFDLANWEKGYGDFCLKADLTSLRILPWLPFTAVVICDVVWDEKTPVSEAPRNILKKQLGLLAGLGLNCKIASELEFYLFNTSYPTASANNYTGLKPSSDFRIDYHVMQPGRDEEIMRAIRNGMDAAEIPVESSKGEWGKGQHELNFVYGEPVAIADGHVIFKQGAKEIAEQKGKAITFMAKPHMEEAGNSCHIHISLWKKNQNVFWDAKEKKPSLIFRQFLAGLLKYSPELCYFYGPTINSYKRYQPSSWAPTKMAWAYDNRTVGFRVVGHGSSFRIENRMPGADANPYLAFTGMLIAGLAGIEEKLDCGDVYLGNAYVDEKLASLPSSLQVASELLNKSGVARSALGDKVVDFYVHTARNEVKEFGNCVTDWERRRYFEQI